MAKLRTKRIGNRVLSLAMALLFTLGLWVTPIALAEDDSPGSGAYSAIIPEADYATVAEASGGLLNGTVRVGTGARGNGFMADNTSFWSGVDNGNSGVVASGRSAFFRVTIPEEVTLADIDNMTVQFAINTTHNSGNISLSLFAMNESLPSTVSSLEADGTQGVANKALYSFKEYVAQSNTVASTVGAGTLITFDITEYAKSSQTRVLEFAMLADAQMLTLYDASGVLTTNQSYYPQWSLTWSSKDPLQMLSIPEKLPHGYVLPNTSYGANVTWSCSAPGVLDGYKIVSGKTESAVTLTATVNGNTKTFDVTIMALGTEESNDSDVVKDMELIANFNFNDPVNGLAGAGAKANVHGTANYAPGANGTMAASLGSGFWLDVTKEDGSSLLKGLSEFAISYDSSPASSGNNGWAFFATRTYRAPKSSYESYLGVIDVANRVTVERFHNSGSRPAFGLYAVPTNTGWRHVDVVFTKGATRLYIDGVLKNIQTSDYPIEQVLSEAGGILYIGSSTWGSEYFTGLIDNFKIWKTYDPDDAGKVAAAKAALSLPYGLTENQVYGNITLPETGRYGTTITWATDRPDIVDLNEYPNPGSAPKRPGSVTRPADADKIVTMMATITSGNVSDTKTFNFTVKKAPGQLEEKEAYLFAHFTGTEGSPTDEQIYFAVSEDAKTWQDLTTSGNPILTSDKGDQGVRDPYIIRSPEGDKFYLIATDLNINRRGGWGSASWQCSSTKLAIWESTDLVNWSDMRLVDVAGAIPDAGMAWAPEVVYDDVTGDYFVFWATLTTVASSVGNSPTIFCARTRDFYTFTEPVHWILKNDIIDTTVMKANDGYWYRATQTGNITIERATSLTGTWQTIGNLQNYFSGDWSYGAVEGPELFIYNEKDWQQDGVPTYGLYVDRYGQGAGYMPFYTSDLSATTRPPWYVGADINMGAMKKRHGGILSVTKAEYDSVVKAFMGKQTSSELDTSDMTLIADFDFNGLASSGNTTVTGGGARGTISGTVSRNTDRPDESGYSANFGSSGSNFITVVKADGTPLLAGLEEIVISYDSKPSTMSSNGGWAFYAAANTSTQTYNSERYLGIMDKRTGTSAANILVERYRNSGSRPSNNLTWSTNSTTAWKHVDLWVRKDSTVLYVDGEQVSSSASSTLLSDIVSSSGGIIQIGKANWTSSGEFYRGLIDNFKIYDAAGATPASGLLTAVKASEPAYTTVHTAFDDKALTAKLYISYNNSQIKDVTAVPLDFTLLAGAEIVDKQAAYDLTSPVSITVTHGQGGSMVTEAWTISAEISHNPVLGGRYADPDIIIANGKYYIYPTTDGYAGWGGYQFKVFSSVDMINWVDEGIILDLQASESYLNSKGVAVATVPWSNGNAWAPAIEHKDGKYYFYFCGNNISSNNKAIGVAVSDSPTGPFTVRSTPLLTLAQCSSAGISMGQVIDPNIYTDENDVSWMLFGNGNAAIVQLSEDMMDWVPGTLKNISGATDLREAITVTKIDNLYHFTWSCDDTGSENYRVRYGVSDSLFGPILDKGLILQKDNANGIKGTGHHDVLHHPDLDEYFIVYHRFWTPLGQELPSGSSLGNNRETCIDRMVYKDGMFGITTPTNRGISEPIYAMADGKTVFSHKNLKPNETIKATTALLNTSGSTETARVILALYDAAGRLVSFDMTETFDVADGEYKTAQTSITLPSDVTGLTIKAFIWNEDYQPIRPATEF